MWWFLAFPVGVSSFHPRVYCNTRKAFLNITKGICHSVALLPFTLTSILRQKKNYGNSNISPCKNIIFKNSCEKNQNPSRYYNSITNLKFQTQAKIYHLSKILR
jgi:hypothetical protein